MIYIDGCIAIIIRTKKNSQSQLNDFLIEYIFSQILMYVNDHKQNRTQNIPKPNSNQIKTETFFYYFTCFR